uniref:RIN4 pathogenic type III effector avirulence factor Avr cleavage site domain-containing protein n=1 Tax=Oryza punctata TaxID=4537 RepID=A0A0E0LDS3_ORYPU
MAKRPSVPKFGTWEGDNVGYTVYFDKIRENKGATAPPLHRPYNPNDPTDNPGVIRAATPAPSSRPATSSGLRESQRQQPSSTHQHRRSGSNSSVSSDPGGIQSKFAPPPQYRPSPSPQYDHHSYDHGRGHGHGHHPPPTGYNGGGGGRRAPSPSPQVHAVPRHHHHQVAPKARSASTSPQHNIYGRQRASAVPKFGVWDEQNGAAAAQGFTVMFDNVKRNREAARGAGAAGVVPRSPPQEINATAVKHSRDHSLMSKMFGCFQPTTRE